MDFDDNDWICTYHFENGIKANDPTIFSPSHPLNVLIKQIVKGKKTKD